MASQREIKIGSRDFVVRLSGKDVPVEVVSKVTGDSGRSEWKLKNLVTGRTLQRTSAALRHAGEPPRQAPAGFGKARGAAQNKPVTAAGAHQIPASTFGSQQFGSAPTQSFGSAAERSFGSYVRDSGKPPQSGLGSLRGKIKVPERAPPVASAPEKPKPRRVPQNGGGYPSELVRDLCEALKRTSGTEYEARNVFGQVLAEYSRRRFYPGFAGTPPIA